MKGNEEKARNSLAKPFFKGWWHTSSQLNIKTWWVEVRVCCWASLSGQLWLYPHLWSLYFFKALYLLLSILCQAFCCMSLLLTVFGLWPASTFSLNNNLTLIIGACHIHLYSCLHQVPWGKLCHLWTAERLGATAANYATVQKIWYRDRCWLLTYGKTLSKQEIVSRRQFPRKTECFFLLGIFSLKCWRKKTNSWVTEVSVVFSHTSFFSSEIGFTEPLFSWLSLNLYNTCV